MSQALKGSFVSTSSVSVGQISSILVIPSGTTVAKLTATGFDASNRLKTQKSTDNGHTWADQVTYNANQAASGVVVVHGEQWRLVSVAQQPMKVMDYEFRAQS